MDRVSAMLFGFAMGIIFMAGLAIQLHNWGKFECQQDLPRTQHCEKKWVAP